MKYDENWQWRQIEIFLTVGNISQEEREKSEDFKEFFQTFHRNWAENGLTMPEMRKQLVLECRKRGYYVPKVISDSVDNLEYIQKLLEKENEIKRLAKENKRGWLGGFGFFKQQNIQFELLI